MKEIYLIRYDNGEKYPEDYEEFTLCCYSSKEKALQKIEELKKNEKFLKNVVDNDTDITNINFWVEVVELVN